MQNSFPWYDSIWLNSYIAAKAYLEEYHPEKLDAFVNSFEILRTHQDFETIFINDIFNKEILANIKEVIKEQSLQQLEKQELISFGRFVIHNQAYFHELQKQICPLVSELVKEEVEPSYNFLSLYNNLGICPIHMDSPEAKWTLDLCIDQSSEWPIFFSEVEPWPEHLSFDDPKWESAIKNDPAKAFSSYSLNPGEAIIFSGSSQWHYRERITRQTKDNFSHLLFFHFIPKGTQQIIDPQEWPSLFNIPDLASVLPVHQNTTAYKISNVWQKGSNEKLR